MKILIASIVLALGLVGTNGLNAAIDTRIYVVDREDKQLGILVLGDSNASFSVRFMDLDGRTLHMESALNIRYSKQFDLNNLPKGQYRLEVEDMTQIKLFSIDVLESVIEIENISRKLVVKPKMSVEKDGIVLQMSTFKSPLQVRIFNRRGELIYRKMQTEIENGSTKYDLSKHGKGTYRIEVDILSQTFSDTLTID